MHPITRPKALDLAAAALRRELQEQRFAGPLPGSRVLAKHLGVSPPTVAAALRCLAEEGLLVREGRRKAYRVADMRERAVPPDLNKRLLILTNEEPPGCFPNRPGQPWKRCGCG